jgi:transposase-like protein
MGKHYSEELKNEIVNKYLNNEGSTISLEKEYNISYKTIFDW